MTDTWRLAQLGSWLRLFAALIFTGTIAELLPTGHDETRTQLIPFVLCGAGLAALLLEWRWPRPALTRLLLGTLAVVGAGSLVGVAFHLQSNLQSVLERQPELTGLALGLALVVGRTPFGAPGMLAVGALIAGAAVYAGRQPAAPGRAWARPARGADGAGRRRVASLPPGTIRWPDPAQTRANPRRPVAHVALASPPCIQCRSSWCSRR